MSTKPLSWVEPEGHAACFLVLVRQNKLANVSKLGLLRASHLAFMWFCLYTWSFLGICSKRSSVRYICMWRICSFTHSPNFENFKYDDVPDKHFSRYIPSSLPPAIGGEGLEAALLQPGNSY